MRQSRAAHKTAPEKAEPSGSAIVDDCGRGRETVRAAPRRRQRSGASGSGRSLTTAQRGRENGRDQTGCGRRRTADREKRGVEPRWNGNTEERAAYHAAQNAKHKEQAQADMERLFAPLLPASSKSGERTILLEAIKKEIEDPPQQGKGVYIKFNMIRYFLNAHGVAGGKPCRTLAGGSSRC